jgi:hypothetical protein
MNRTKGTTQVGTSLDSALVESAREFAKSRGETFREVLEAALQRHMANPPPIKTPPPPPVYPPLPPFPPPKPATSAPAVKGKGSKKK